MSLIDIWNEVQRPFIAKSLSGWFVMIKKDPNIQAQKYRGKIYGAFDKSINALYLKYHTRPIEKAHNAQWQLCEIIYEDNH